MGLPYWVETLRTIPGRLGNMPGSLLSHVGVEYNYPYLTPYLDTSISVSANPSTASRGAIGNSFVYDAYAVCFFSIKFHYYVPDTIRMTATLQTNLLFSVILTGIQAENGIDYIQWLFFNDALFLRVENLTNMNQRFGMVSQFLICKTEQDYILARDTLELVKFPFISNGIKQNGGR